MERLLAYWAVFLLPFLSLSPVTDFTLLGNSVRIITITILVIVFVARLNRSLGALSNSEILFFAYMAAIGGVSTVFGILANRYAEPSMMAKFFLLQLLIYFVAISIRTLSSIKKILYLYYLLCLFASVQAILALAAEFLGVRELGAIGIDDGRAEYHYQLSWFGLLGGDVGNGRTNFYFSEATHFAHFLVPGIAFALGMRKYWGLGLLLGGFASTFSGAASAILLVYLLVWVFRASDIRALIAIIVFFAVGYALLDVYVNLDEGFNQRLFNRESSVEDKALTYLAAFQALMEHPFGLGVFNTPDFYGISVNTSGGLFNWIVWFGWLSVPAVGVLLTALLYVGLRSRDDPILASLGFGMFFLSLGTFTHGPLPKYYMVFFYGLLFRYWALRNATIPRLPGVPAPQLKTQTNLQSDI